MTEAEALAIAMRAIVSAFVTAPAPAPAPPPPPPASIPRRKPTRKKKPAAARAPTFADLPPMPSFDLPLTAEPESDAGAPPPVTVAELEALMNGSAPTGTYAREEREEVGGGWLGPQ